MASLFYLASDPTNGLEIDIDGTLNKTDYLNAGLGITEDNFVKVIMGSKVRSIGTKAFYDCEQLHTVTIGDNVTTIGKEAFASSSNIQSLTIGDSVTSIGEEAFSLSYDLVSVTIPNSVTSIGNRAFYYCFRLRSVTLGDSVTSISNEVFRECSALESVTIPDSVTSIGLAAFYECEALKSVTIPNSVTSIGSSAFGSSGLQSVTIPDSVTSINTFVFQECYALRSVTIGDSVTSISDYAFAYCNRLESVNIPDSVTIIGSWAFRSCLSLQSMTIPDTVTSIIREAFYGCIALKSVRLPNGMTTIAHGVFQRCTALNSVTIPDSVTSIGNYAFDECRSLQSLTMHDSITSFGEYAFRNTGLTSLTIPNSMTSIGNSAFEDCIALQSVTIPDRGTSIGNNAFKECSALQSVTIPDSVTSIGNGAFSYCSALENVTLGDTLIGISPSIFQGCTSLQSVTIPDSVTSIGSSAFSVCSALQSVTIGNSVTSINDSAFYQCRALESVNIPDSVTTISNSAFSACSGLQSVTIGDSVTSIGRNAFRGSGLQSITIPHRVTSISREAFGYCRALEFVNIHNKVTNIGYRAFLGCSALLSIAIPDSVTRIEYEAFYQCYALHSVIIGDSVTRIDGSAFQSCDALRSLIIGDSVKTIDYDAFKSCRALQSVTIPDSVTSIGRDAFRFSRLQSVTISNNVNSIGTRVFQSCHVLQSVTIGYSVTSIGQHAFQFCRELESMTIPDSVTNIANDAFSGCTKLKTLTMTSNNGFTPQKEAGEQSIGGRTVNVIITNLENNCEFYLSGSPSTAIIIPTNGILKTTDYLEANKGITKENLERVVIKEGVAYIDTEAFFECKTLKSVTISNGVTSIGKNAFHSCKALESVTIPGSVTTIGVNAFQSCDKLHSVTIGNGTRMISRGAFQSCKKLTSVTIPNTVKFIRNNTFKDCDSIESFTIPDGITNIGNGAFQQCSKLRSITIPNSVRIIGNDVFRNCAALESVTFGDSVTSIGDSAFRDCVLLQTFTIPSKNLRNIGNNAFLQSGIAKIILFSRCIKLLGFAMNAKQEVGGQTDVMVKGYDYVFSQSNIISGNETTLDDWSSDNVEIVLRYYKPNLKTNENSRDGFLIADLTKIEQNIINAKDLKPTDNESGIVKVKWFKKNTDNDDYTEVQPNDNGTYTYNNNNVVIKVVCEYNLTNESGALESKEVTSNSTIVSQDVIPDNEFNFLNVDAIKNETEDKEYQVTVENVDGYNKYFIDNTQQKELTLYKGLTYTFKFTNSSVLSNHPFRFSTNNVLYNNGVTVGADSVKIKIWNNAPSILNYYCTRHSNMGGSITIKESNFTNVEFRKTLTELAVVDASLKEDGFIFSSAIKFPNMQEVEINETVQTIEGNPFHPSTRYYVRSINKYLRPAKYSWVNDTDKLLYFYLKSAGNMLAKTKENDGVNIIVVDPGKENIQYLSYNETKRDSGDALYINGNYVFQEDREYFTRKSVSSYVRKVHKTYNEPTSEKFITTNCYKDNAYKKDGIQLINVGKRSRAYYSQRQNFRQENEEKSDGYYTDEKTYRKVYSNIMTTSDHLSSAGISYDSNANEVTFSKGVGFRLLTQNENYDDVADEEIAEIFGPVTQYSRNIDSRRELVANIGVLNGNYDYVCELTFNISYGSEKTQNFIMSYVSKEWSKGVKRAISLTNNSTNDTCFSGDSQLTLKDGTKKKFHDIQVGDEIQVCSQDMKLSYSKVIFLSHMNNKEIHNFIKLITKSNAELYLTPNHYIPISNANNKLKNALARDVKITDKLFTLQNNNIILDEIKEIIETQQEGIYTCNTHDGEYIVVDNVVASPFIGDRSDLSYVSKYLLSYNMTKIYAKTLTLLDNVGILFILAPILRFTNEIVTNILKVFRK